MSEQKNKVSVTVQLGITKNTGNYENVKYDVALTVEGEAGKEDALYEYANDWVGKKVNKFSGKS